MMDEQRTWLRSRRKRRLGILTVMLSVCVLITTYPGIPVTLSVFASEEPELSLPDTLEAASFRSVSPGNAEIGNGQDAQPEDGAESEETDEATEPTETDNGEPFAIQEESLAIQEEMEAADGAHGEHAGWTKLTVSTTTLTAGGNYYLDEDITVSNELKVTGGTVTLCLNGHTLSRRSSDAKSWIITVESGATLNVYDCAGGGMMEATSKGGGISTAGTLNVYGGIINGKDSAWWNKDQVTLTYGAGICAQAGSEVNLFGGTVKGTMSSGVYVVSGGKLTVDGAEVISQFESHPDGYAASIYIEGGAETWIKSGFVSWSSETYNSCTIFVSPGGSLNVSGGTVSQERDDVAGAIAVTKHSYHTSLDAGHVVISGGTVSTPIAATSGMRVTVSGGHVIKEVVLRGAVLELSGDQDIQGGAGTDIIIGVDRSDDAVVKMAIGKIELTGALTNTKPYMVRLEGLIPASVYPLTITQGFDSYMSGREPTDYFVSTDGYKIVLLDGEVAFVPYVMTFDANGGSVVTTQGDINGGNQMRALPEPTREHYNFDGWYTAKTGGDKITIDTMPAGRDLTVYAHWTPVDYGISYDLAGGMLQDGDSNPASYHIETPDFALKNPVRAGYIFTGWSGTGLTGAANKAVTVSKGSTGERAYTAHWEEAKYKMTISTYKDDALWSNGAPAVKLTADNGSSFVTDLTAVGNGSYRIYSGNTDTGVTVTVGGADAAGRVDYYTLSFYDRNSELTQNRQTVLKNCEAQKPSAPTRTGYIFAGWCDNADLTGTPVTEISTPITAKQTFYAKWTAAEYKVTFDYQGATGDSTVTDKTVTYEAAYGELPAPTKAEYVFKGWYTSENGQGDPVTAATIVQNASDHTLFAYWKDETAPDQPVLQDGVTLPAGWTKAQDTIPLKLYDGVGVTALLVSVDGSPYAEVSGFSGGTGSVNYSYTAVQEGEHKYQFKAVDAAGNFAESDIFTVKLDRTKPEIGTLIYENEVHINFWHWIIGKKSMIVHVPVTDTGSGVTKISYTLTPRDAAGNLDSSKAETKTEAVTNGEAEITFDKDFRGPIAISCTDGAGNAADSVTVGKEAGGIIIEDNAPQIAFQAENAELLQTTGEYKTAPDITVTVTDNKDNAISAGIASVGYKIGNGSEKTVAHDYATGMVVNDSFTIPAGEISAGETKITVTATDNAGNSVTQNYTVKVHTHSGTLVQAVEPTCTVAGNKEYYTCTCGKEFSDSGCTNEITDHTEVIKNALGHDFTGKYQFDTEEHWKKCSRCPATDSREAHSFEEGGIHCTKCEFEKAGEGHTHTGELHERVEPTCTTAGNKEYYTCTCGKWFSDSSCTVEITDKSKIEIAALEHDFVMKHDQNEHWQQCSRCSLEQSRGPHEYDDNSDTDCNVCGYVRTVQHTHSGVLVPAVEPTCTEDGHEAYYTCSCGKWFSDSGCVNEIADHASVIVEKRGHDFSGGYQSDENDHWKVCSRCGETEPKEGHVYDSDTDTDCNQCGYRRNIENPGNVSKDVEKDEKAPDTVLSDSAEQLADIILTEEEKGQIGNGTDIKFILNVKDAGDTVSSGDRTAVQQALDGNTVVKGFSVGQYLDISLFKVIGDTRSAISQTARKLTIVINVPESLKSKDSTKPRTYAIIRVHDGVTEVLADLDGDADTVTIATDRFSAYALVYKEAGSGADVKPTLTPGGGDKPTPTPGGSDKPSPTPGGKDNVTPAPSPSGEPEKASGKEKRKIEIHSGLKAIQTGKKLQVSWGRVTGADGYGVYVQYCGKDFSTKSLNQVKSGKKTKITVKKVNGKKLDTTKNFKLYVVAWKWKNGKKSTLAKTLTIHVAGKDSVKYTNVKSIQVKKSSYTLKKGGTVTLHPKAVLYDKHKKQLSVAHCKEFRYLSSNKKVAMVTAGGKVKAKGTGECTIYVFAKNGCRRKIKIKVKK